MLFNSLEYFVFLPLLFLLYWSLGKKEIIWQNILLLSASYFFYAWWSWKFLGLLAFSTILDYCYGFAVNTSKRKKALLFVWLSVINNLGILAVFKYYNFFAAEFQILLTSLGWHANMQLLELVLPIGISFYTFHGMSYVFDSYRGKIQPVRNLVDYSLFVSFFPLLVAGPIERATHLMPQIQTKRIFNYHNALIGCRMMVWGLFKKVILADGLAPFADDCFANYSDYNGSNLLIGMIAFSFQIYCDFSGYSDIASGTAKLLGFNIVQNFNFPYFSKSITEFWQKWHISLTSWFRDYLYIPLGGSKMGKLITVRNTLIVFLLSGLWHGALWHFIVWGLIHALAFIPSVLLSKNTDNTSNKHSIFFKGLKVLLSFSFVCLAWTFFRANSVNSAIDYLTQTFSSLFSEPQQLLNAPKNLIAFLFIIPLIIGDLILKSSTSYRLFRFKLPLANYIAYLLLSVLIIYGLFNGEANDAFIYFQF